MFGRVTAKDRLSIKNDQAKRRVRILELHSELVIAYLATKRSSEKNDADLAHRACRFADDCIQRAGKNIEG